MQAHTHLKLALSTSPGRTSITCLCPGTRRQTVPARFICYMIGRLDWHVAGRRQAHSHGDVRTCHFATTSSVHQSCDRPCSSKTPARGATDICGNHQISFASSSWQDLALSWGCTTRPAGRHNVAGILPHYACFELGFTGRDFDLHGRFSKPVLASTDVNGSGAYLWRQNWLLPKAAPQPFGKLYVVWPLKTLANPGSFGNKASFLARRLRWTWLPSIVRKSMTEAASLSKLTPPVMSLRRRLSLRYNVLLL